MKIAGYQPLSLIDYPDRLAAIVWTQGCNFKCPFCYNPQLIKMDGGLIEEKNILYELDMRREEIEGLVITGGEPTIQPDLIDFIKKVKDIGLLVKLDTNGSNPNVIKELIENKLVDYIAMDIKSNFVLYPRATGVHGFVDNIKESIELIKNSKIEYEFRTTLVPTILKAKHIAEIAEYIGQVNLYVIQQFDNTHSLLNKNLKKEEPYTDDYLNYTLQWARMYLDNGEIRR